MQRVLYINDVVDKVRLYDNLVFAFENKLSHIPVLANAVKNEVIKSFVKKVMLGG